MCHYVQPHDGIILNTKTNYAIGLRIEPTLHDKLAMPNHTHHQAHFRLGTTQFDSYKVVVPCHDESTSIAGPQALMCLWVKSYNTF
jgi:hypothetical protein